MKRNKVAFKLHIWVLGNVRVQEKVTFSD